MSIGLGLVLDILVLLCLGVTIFYASKLSVYLNSFRKSREDMDRFIKKLSKDITHAEHVVESMNVSAQETVEKLQSLVHEARFLSDELRFMNETGDSLANRLEKLAESNKAEPHSHSVSHREFVTEALLEIEDVREDTIEESAYFGFDSEQYHEGHQENYQEEYQEEHHDLEEYSDESFDIEEGLKNLYTDEERAGFAIRDPEYDEGDIEEPQATQGNIHSFGLEKEIRSQAENELREALEKINFHSKRRMQGRV